MRNNQPAAGNAGLLGALATPYSNWAGRLAAGQQAVQLSALNAAQKEEEALQMQQADARTQDFFQQVNSTPFMGRDLQKVQAFKNAEEKALQKRLAEVYGGDIRKWHAVEGPDYINRTISKLRQSDFYQKGLQNIQNVLQAQEAVNKGEYLVGSGNLGAYRTGEQSLQDFLTGKADSFTFGGSYKPEDDFKAVRDTYAPGRMPWERVPLTEEEKLNHLYDNYGQQVGLDKYLRQHQGTQVFYKTDPITKLYDFQRDQGRFQMEAGRYGMAQRQDARQAASFASSEALKQRQRALLDLKIADKFNELSGGRSGQGYAESQFLAPTETIRFQHDPTAPKKLPSGLNIGSLTGLVGNAMFGKADQLVSRQLGMQKTKDGWTRGRINEGFTEQNGVHGFSLQGSNFKVLTVDPSVYHNPADIHPGKGPNPNGVNGYARITVQFNSDADADKAGLYNERWLIPNASTMSGTGVYDPDTKQATFFTPIGKIDSKHNPGFSHAWRAADRGMRDANEEGLSPYLDISF